MKQSQQQPGFPSSQGATISECVAQFSLLLIAWTAYILLLYPAIVALDDLPRLLAGETCRFIAFALPPLLWVGLVLQRNVQDAFKLSRPLIGLGWGIGAGLVLFVFALVRAEFVMPAGIRPLWPSWFTALSAVATAPFCEELLFRGFFLQRLAQRYSFWTANTLAAVAFVLIHFPGWILISSGGLGSSSLLPTRFLTILDILVLGLLSGWLLQRSGTLWACVAIHAVNNFLSIVLFS